MELSVKFDRETKLKYGLTLLSKGLQSLMKPSTSLMSYVHSCTFAPYTKYNDFLDLPIIPDKV